MPSLPDGGSKPDHAVFLIHGLWGNKAHFWYIEEQLKKTFPLLKVHACAVNEGNKTYDGIDVGGDRVLTEIEETLAKWKAEGEDITKISIVGYSLGGLISRYVIGLMYARGLFETIKPINFTTFASPHLGIRHINPGVFHSLANLLGPRMLSASGRQMFIADRDPFKPILVRMAEKDSIFMRALALFRNRTAYANIINDRSVPFYTAAISQYDPYINLSKLNLSYIPSYEPIVLHPTHPIIPLSKPKEHIHPNTTGRWIRLIVIMFLLPFWATFFILAALYQSFCSARRIQKHIRLHDLEDSDREEEAGLLSEAVQEVFEDVVDNAALLSPGEDHNEYFEDDVDETTRLVNGGDHDGLTEKAVSLQREDYRLALTDEQIAMLNGLRSVQWQTFGVHIHQTTHSHAAIIRRHKWRAGLGEGEAVIRHWLDNQFLA